MTAYPLLQILFFIAAFFAPKGATKITLVGTDQIVNWTLTSSGWSNDKKAWRLQDESTVVSESGRADKVVDVSKFVEAAVKNDWTKENKVRLDSMTTIEKTPAGFTFRENAGDRAEKVYQITYGEGS